MRGTRFFQFSNFKRFSHHFGNYFRRCDMAVPFCDRSEHLDHIDILMALIMKSVETALGCYSDQWGFIKIGIRDSGDQIGGSWSEGTQAYSRFPRQPSPDICNKSGSLFMPAGDKLYGRGFKRKKKIFILFSRHAENMSDTFSFKA